MSAIFEQFVDQLTLSKEQLAEDYSTQLKEWKKNLEALYRDIESYLKPYIDSKKITVKYEDKQIVEEELGLYTVKSAKINIGSQRIRLDPIGTVLIAARGRVDMIGPRGSVKLVFVPMGALSPVPGIVPRWGEISLVSPSEWAWKIATAPPNMKYIDLDETVFQEAMMSVANV